MKKGVIEKVTRVHKVSNLFLQICGKEELAWI